MNSLTRTVKLSLYMLYIFAAILALSALSLPFLVTWYVETMGRDATLPATIMLTCYPCLPFAVIALLSLRKMLNNMLAGLVLGDKNISCLRSASLCCFAITAITVAAGRLYKPFFILALSAAACGFSFFVAKSIIEMLLGEQRRKEAEEIEENL